jgi:acetolactate synthase I/II/III large subunit
MIKTSAAIVDKRWAEYPAEEWSDALVTSMKLGGIDNLFFVSGTELGFYQEAIAKANDLGRPAPRLVTMVHEGVALNAALGSIMVTGKPAATAAHVDLGLQNYGAAIHTAWRGNYPVLITSGAGPRAYPGSMRGARDNFIQWVQETRDQGEIVRQYTKMDHRLEHEDNPGLIVSRMLQVSMSEPAGPVYLAVPRESAMLELQGSISFPTRDQLGVARPAAPTVEDAKTIARWLIEADNPCIYVARSGRNPQSVEALVRLSELLGVPVNDHRLSQSMNFPTTHPHHNTGPEAQDADAIVVIESPMPWYPHQGPKPEVPIAWIDPDPVQSRYKTMEFMADLWLSVDPTEAANAIYEAATGMLSASDMSRIEDRKARLARRKQEQWAAAEEAAQSAGRRSELHPRWVSYQIQQLLEPEALLLDEALSNSDTLRQYSRRSLPGTFFKRQNSTGGWGSGAAFGAKLVSPDRDVVLASGDGFFMFGSPLEALWAGAYHKAPYLSVIYVNRSYSTGVGGLDRLYPEGAAARNAYPGGTFDPPPDFAKLAETVGGYGETVSEPEQVGPALRRGLEQTRKGVPAIIACWLPTLVEEMRLPQ